MTPIATASNKHTKQSTELTADHLLMRPIASGNNRHVKHINERTNDYLHMAPVETAHNQHAKKCIEPTADYLTLVSTAIRKKGSTEHPATDHLTPSAKMRDQKRNKTAEKAPKIQENESDVGKQLRDSYDLPLTGYMSPGTDEYTKLTKSPHTHDQK